MIFLRAFLILAAACLACLPLHAAAQAKQGRVVVLGFDGADAEFSGFDETSDPAAGGM